MNWNNKRILITGGAGVIGKELIKRLELEKANILCLDLVDKPKELSDSSIKYTKIDISEITPDIITVFDPHIIFHLAATFERTEETPDFWDDNFKDNILLSHKVIDAAKECTSLEKFIFASSYLIYSPMLYLTNAPQSYATKLRETDLPNPRNLCGAAKYYTEKELEFISDMHNIISISARIYRVYGLGSRDIISRWIRMALKNEELIVFQKENMFDYIFAGDVAEGLIKIAETVEKSNVINLGTGTARRIEDVITLISKQIADAKIKELKPQYLFEGSCADITELIKLTGWQPNTTLEEGIKKIVAYEVEINAQTQR